MALSVRDGRQSKPLGWTAAIVDGETVYRSPSGRVVTDAQEVEAEIVEVEL